MAKKKNRSLMVQKIAVGAAAVLIVTFFGYFYTRVIAEAPKGKFVEGEHYQLIDHPGHIHGNKVQIMEFFSYACPHCYAFDPQLRDWVQSNKDRIEFTRTPAVGTTEWRMFARAYYAMDALGILQEDHEKLFNAIHAQGLNLGSPERLAAWFADNGTTAAAFTSMFNSAAVTEQVNRAEEMQQRFKISAVPSIVIDSKYLVQMTQEVGPSRMLDVVDYLVDKEMSGNKTSAGAPAK